MQNLFDGPFGEGIADDQFGGPDPVNDHLTGVILRLNPDGTSAARQPVLQGRRRARRPGRGEPQEDLRLRPAQRLRHGVRPVQRRPLGAGERRRLLLGDQPRRARLQLRLDAGDGPARARRPVQGDRDDPRAEPARPERARRLLRPPAGPLGPDQHRRQRRGTPTTACSSSPARSSPIRSWPGSTRSPRAASTSSPTKELGKDYKGDLFVGSARGALRGGNLFRLKIEDNRKKVDVSDDRRLKDRVADNLGKYEITESESLLFGENFGVTPDVKESPDGTLYVVSSTQGNVYEIRRK